MKRALTLLADLFIGIPGGLLIVMGMLMLHALLERLGAGGEGWRLALLCVTAFITGMLARLTRLVNGFGTAVASGTWAAGILLWLRLTSEIADGSLAFGVLGMAVVVVFAALGGWILPRLRKTGRKK